MIWDVFTFGSSERKIVIDWKDKQDIDNKKVALFIADIHNALDAADYSFKVAWGEEYTSEETILYLAYNMAIGRIALEEGMHLDSMREILEVLSEKRT